MAMKRKRCISKPKLLSSSRPKLPTVKPPALTLTSKASRNIIRNHHTLSKQLAKALREGDAATATKLTKEIEAQGGIRSYQRASLTGQSTDRGGDSSKLLIAWLSPLKTLQKKLRMLEVGSLSTDNACSRSGWFDVERIDLHSHVEGIQQQDFMERPLPKLDDESFDIISLSLVLNYVPDAIGKGEMLRRTLKFLRHPSKEFPEYFPSLFLVLPAPCVENSRYMDEARLEAIMNSLGYVKIRRKLTTKLAYYLWRKDDTTKDISFKKVEIRSGKSRNNFAVVLQ